VHNPLESAILELVLGAELEVHNPRTLDAWLSRHRVSEEDSRAIREQGLEGLLVYRRLVRSRLRETMELAIERTINHLGPVFDEYFDRFLAERGPRTHYLRDVTGEFLDFCEPLWKADERVADYSIWLGRHEELQVEMAAMEVSADVGEAGPLELDLPLRFIAAARVVRYPYAVHELPISPGDREAPAARPTALLAYRDSKHHVHNLELTTLAASILERLLHGRITLRQAAVEACGENGIALSEAVLTGLASVLSDLAQRGVLLGAAHSR
jgi:hypothetical protein